MRGQSLRVHPTLSRCRRRWAGLVLLFLLCAPMTGAFLWLTYERMALRKEIRKAMIAGMDKNELVLLRFSREEAGRELHWEHAKEFEYRGEMYDIVEAGGSPDSVWYRCWWDNEETRLNRQLDELVSFAHGRNRAEGSEEDRIYRFFKLLWLSEPTLDASSCDGSRSQATIEAPDLYLNISGKGFSPPPERA